MSEKKMNDPIKELLTNLVAEVNKWNMYVPSAEVEAEISKTADRIKELKAKEYGLEIK